METDLVRSLEEGPDYTPNWRELQAEKYLEIVATSAEPKCTLREILWAEKDPFVRQFLRYRFDGRSANQMAFRYAAGCVARNRETGSASLIKAMLVADRTSDEIAAELGTKTQNVVTFAKIYFDISRYLDKESWLCRLVFQQPPEGIAQPETLRERRWLAAAFHRGWPGVQQVALHQTSGNANDMEELSLRLKSTLVSRALEYALDLETSDSPTTEADLQRFISVQSIQPDDSSSTGSPHDLMVAFIRGLHGDLLEKAEANPDDPMLTEYRSASTSEDSAPPSQRRRKRFAR